MASARATSPASRGPTARSVVKPTEEDATGPPICAPVMSFDVRPPDSKILTPVRRVDQGDYAPNKAEVIQRAPSRNSNAIQRAPSMERI